ncbi:MAG: serine/threonine protein kinase [Phycicoccus sp.]|nr:serine/threonine protein kinase [Phycicoccus sp.]
MPNQLIAGRYQVLRAIGRGGMGTVWLCRDDVLGREVAVKQMGALPGESATETKRAMREARSTAAFSHPNAVAVYDVVNHNERPWLVMEYVEGETLADEISRDGQLSPRRVADIGAQLAGALARAHQRRIVHRDIKPANVLIDKAGRPKISDFGIARGQGDDQLTAIGFITGTPGYLSPELARGEDPHPASDVWALGATLYAAVEGRSPYESRSNPIALLRAIATEPPRPMTHAGALAPAIAAMMDEDPANRWDMATSAKRLGGIAAVEATAVMPVAASGDTAVMPVVASGATAVMPVVIAAPVVEPTKRFEAGAPQQQPPDERGSGRRRVSLGLAALLLAAMGMAFFVSQLGDQGGTPLVLATTRATTPAQTAAPSPSRVSEEPTTRGDQKHLESFLKSYYSNVTKDTDRTWDQLSPRMQSFAGGREGYDDFWKKIDKVRVNEVRAYDSGTKASVGLTFTRDHGGTSTETHQFTFITQDGDYLIDSDRLG